MANTISGGIVTTVNVQNTLDVSTTRFAQVTVPVQTTHSTAYTTGTTANKASKVAVLSDSAAGTPYDINLATIVCTDGTVGLSHVRDGVVANDDTTNALKVGDDGTVTNSFNAYSTATHPLTNCEPGGVWRICKPLGTAGYVVDSTHKNVRLDPGANTIAFRAVFVGD